MANRRGRRILARVQRVGHQFESNGAVREGRRLIHELPAFAIFNPELTMAGADTIHGAFEKPGSVSVARLIH